MKVLINQYKRVYRYRALGGDDSGNYYHAALQSKFEDVRLNYHYWIYKLAQYSKSHGTTIAIKKEDIKDARVIDSSQSGTSKLDDQMERLTTNTPAFFELLRTHAKEREKDIVPLKDFEEDILELD